MTTGAALCATCAAPIDPISATCARCGERVAADGAPRLPLLLAGCRPAPTATRVLAVALDVLIPLLLAAPAVVGRGGALPGTVVVASLVAALAYGAGCVVGQALTGRTPAKLLLGLRAVDLFSGLPLGLRRGPAERWASTVVLDVRGARDPATTVDDGVWARLAQVATAGFGPASAASVPAAGGPAVRAATAVPAGPPMPPRSAPAPAVPSTVSAAPAPAVPLAHEVPTPHAVPGALPAPPEPAVLATPLAPRTASAGSAVPETTVLRPARASVPPVPTAGVLVLRLDDGQRFEVRGTALLGRSPEPRAGEEIGTLVPVNDLARSVSKTHAQLRWDGRTCWVLDRGSTNGTSVADADGRRPVTETAEVAVAPGGSVRIGNRELLLELEGIS